MVDYSAMIRSTFEKGSVMDAEKLFETMILNAFPTNTFRRLELIRFLREDEYLEGRSWNHGQISGQECVSGLSDPGFCGLHGLINLAGRDFPAGFLSIPDGSA